MSKDLIEYVDRQCEFLSSLHGVDFIYQLRQWLRTLERRQELAILLVEMEASAKKLVDDHHQEDERLVAEAVAICAALRELVPPLVSSPETPLSAGNPPIPSTFPWFDGKAALKPAGPPLRRHGETKDEGRSHDLLRFLADQLRSTLDDADRTEAKDPRTRASLEALHDRVALAFRGRLRSHRLFVTELSSSPGIAIATIRALIQGLLGNLIQFEEELDADPGLRQPTWVPSFGDRLALRDILFGENTLRAHSDKKGRSLARSVRQLKVGAERVHEELRLRIGTRATLLRLMERFKHRCEWHDAERLFALAENPPKGGAEDALTAELARWLFDNGFSPISKPMMGRLQPDLIDPSRIENLYIEAKQYKRSQDRAYIAAGVRQMADTYGRQRGTQYQPFEAFYVVFRRGGPRFILPETVRLDDVDVHLLLVDIAPGDVSGSRQSENPITIAESELLRAPGTGSRSATRERTRVRMKPKRSRR